MSIRKMKDGKYLVEYYVIDSTTGQRHHLSKTVYGLREAKKFEASVPKYTAITKNEETLWSIFNEFLNTSQANKDTLYDYRKRFDKYVPIKDRKLSLLKKQDLFEWWSWLREQPISNATKNDVMNFVKSTYRYANEMYDIPNISYCIKKLHHEKKEKEILTPEEFELFINQIDHPIYKAFFHTAYWTGCRRGELKGLYKTDLKDGYLMVTRSLPRTEVHDQLKNGTKLRMIKLDEDTLNILTPLSKREGLYLFGDDCYLANTTISRYLRNGLAKAGITKHITIHNFRHSHGSVLLDSGLDLASVAMRLGHKDITTTANIYSHVLDKSGQKSVDIIDSIKGKTLR